MSKNKPDLGELMYLAPNMQKPVKVVRVNEHMTVTVPADTEIKYTHKGNLYNAQGERPYMD